MTDAKEFFVAIQEGDFEKVSQMLAADSTLIYARDVKGNSPILAAAYAGQPEIASLLADRTVLLTIFEAAAIGKITHIIRLLAKDPDLVNAYAQDGSQPLELAAYFGHDEIVDYLLKAGAWVNATAKNDDRAMPLHAAAVGKHLEIARLLIEHGADPNVPQRGGLTPLHISAQSGQVAMLKLLLFNGADLKVKNSDGKTPLDLAIAAENEEAIDLLKRGITKRFRSARKTISKA
ncbi:MAG: ankyrin repeat domain-containing protein [Chloroflexi bacterium]|nr:ankyrin repeat domain-containing protein [Chloroflexota bacterium]